MLSQREWARVSGFVNRSGVATMLTGVVRIVRHTARIAFLTSDSRFIEAALQCCHVGPDEHGQQLREPFRTKKLSDLP